MPVQTLTHAVFRSKSKRKLFKPSVEQTQCTEHKHGKKLTKKEMHYRHSKPCMQHAKRNIGKCGVIHWASHPQKTIIQMIYYPTAFQIRHLHAHLSRTACIGGSCDSAPVTFTVRNSTVRVIYKVRVFWFVDMALWHVLHVVVLHIW